MSEPATDLPLLPPGTAPYARHVYVCVTGGTCPSQNAEQVHAAMKQLVKELCPQTAVRVNKSGCLGQCGRGPFVVVYPENVWYAPVRVEDVPELVVRHLVKGEVVERLLYRGHHAGGNVIKSIL